MRLRLTLAHSRSYVRALHQPQWRLRRALMTLAIETSCDDTSAAVLEKNVVDGKTIAHLHFHKKVTSNNAEFKGVHPLVSLQSHQENLAELVSDAIRHLPPKAQAGGASQPEPETGAVDISKKRLPDFISVTRGPGMRANLFTGIDTAKGLAAAWQVPLVGVHHMQAHALTPRMASALESLASDVLTPAFPFLSVLASGGHTLLIQSSGLTDHRVLGTTNDIAVGECLDKVARILLPAELLQFTKSTMYGALLEKFAFPELEHETTSTEGIEHGSAGSAPSRAQSAAGRTAREHVENSKTNYNWYKVPSNHEEAARMSATRWGWGFEQPLSKVHGGAKLHSLELSFSGLLTSIERVIRFETDPVTKKRTKVERVVDDVPLEEKRDIARESMRAAFEHVAHRVVLGLQTVLHDAPLRPSVVMSGGVAANQFLRHILASTLCARGYSDTVLYFPPPSYCTDNAAMIAWTGLEMFENGRSDPLSIRAIRKWPLDDLLEPKVDG